MPDTVLRSLKILTYSNYDGSAMDVCTIIKLISKIETETKQVISLKSDKIKWQN